MEKIDGFIGVDNGTFFADSYDCQLETDGEDLCAILLDVQLLDGTVESRRYVPERTCHFKTVHEFIDNRRSRGDICECDQCDYRCARGFVADERFKCCPQCSARIEVNDGTT